MTRRTTNFPSSPARDHAAIAEQYARDVLSGKILACKWVRLACQRHLDDLSESEAEAFLYRFDAEKAGRACRFIERLPHVRGDWAKRRERIRLEPPQVFLVASLFGWVSKETALRRFRRAYVEWPRKNAKSTTAAGIGLYLLTADGEEGAEVYCGATSKEQAGEVFRTAQRMVERTPALQKALGVQSFAAAIVQERTGSKMEAIIGKPGDGASPSCAIVDEFHEHATWDLYDTMQTGMGARSQPLTFVITTAGVDLSGPCYQMHLEAKRVLDGLERDDEFFAIIYALDEGDDWTRDEALWKANPLAGIAVGIEKLRSEQRIAIRNAGKSGTFRTKHLNEWVSARSPFFNTEAWKALVETGSGKGGRLVPEDLRGCEAILGLDLASKKDLTARVAVVRKGDLFYVLPMFWLPEERVDEVKVAPYRTWVDAGWMQATPGNVTDYEFIERDLLELRSVLEIKEIAYDPSQATQLSTRMRAEGLPMIEYPQCTKNMSEPMKAADAWILAGKVRHDGSPVQTWCLSNVVSKPNAKDEVYPRKEGERAESKIDGAVAMIFAVGRWLAQGIETGPSRYSEPGAEMFFL
jgi:phage terminase large subunit-like protein